MRHAFPLVIACVSAVGCKPVEPPGTSLGQFSVTGTLTENACGESGLPAEDPLDFEVELRRLTPETGSWVLDSPPGSTGTLRQDGEFDFVRESSYVAIEPSVQQPSANDPSDYWSGEALQDPVAKPGCVLEVREQVRGTLVGEASLDPDAGVLSADPTFTALNVITVNPSPGSDCRQALAVQGGPFAALPCSATYELTGTFNGDAEP